MASLPKKHDNLLVFNRNKPEPTLNYFLIIPKIFNSLKIERTFTTQSSNHEKNLPLLPPRHFLSCHRPKRRLGLDCQQLHEKKSVDSDAGRDKIIYLHLYPQRQE